MPSRKTEPLVRPNRKAAHPTARLNPLSENDGLVSRISLRAYELFLARGGHHGRDLDDWLEAEREVRQEVRQDDQMRTEPAEVALRVDSARESRTAEAV